MDPDPVFGKSGCNGRSKLCGDIHGSKGDLVKMPSQKAEYIIRIGHADRYRHLHIVERGKIVFFRVQCETKIDDKWYPVVRYDTAHGFVHRDLMNIKGDIKKTPLFNQDYNNALTFAENDLKSNWEYYKKRFLEEE